MPAILHSAVIPLLFDFGDETVLVFGGGPVGARKARRFAHEASVVVVSPTFEAADYGGAALVRARPTPEEVPGWIRRVDPALVVAATDDAGLNGTIERAAADRGRLVNRADGTRGRGARSVVLPAIARDGPVVVGVGTGGRSPALSAYLRDRIAGEIEGAGAMAKLTAELREELAEAGLSASRRRDALRRVVENSEVWTALDSKRSNPRQIAADVVADATGDSP